MAKKTANAPSRGLWLLALIVGSLGILAHFGYIDELYQYNYWMLLFGFIALAIGTTFRTV